MFIYGEQNRSRQGESVVLGLLHLVKPATQNDENNHVRDNQNNVEPKRDP